MKKSYFSYKLLLIMIMANFTFVCEACRFTVREIGFSFLSPTIYSLVVVDNQADADAPAIELLRKELKNSNVQLVLLHSQSDANHPFVQKAKAQGITFPCAFILSPAERFFRLVEAESYSLSSLPSLVNQSILRTPLQKHVLREVERNFAYVIRIPGTNERATEEIDQLINQECERVNDIMELMPKSVENPPQVIHLTKADCQKEKLFLWSLGIDSISTYPKVHIVYGRGRYMGKGLNLDDVRKGNVYRYLAMVGADCECNLDRDWMLGTQVPLLWTSDTRQHLAKSLDFDVDNPLILAEMSRILSKEEPGGNATISYTPETIDLDEVFDSENSSQEAQINTTSGGEDTLQDSRTTRTLWLTFIGLVLIGVIGVIFIIRRNREN